MRQPKYKVGDEIPIYTNGMKAKVERVVLFGDEDIRYKLERIGGLYREYELESL